MDINFRTLPSGVLPYKDTSLCKQMILRLFENVPFLPDLPLITSGDNVLNRTIENIPCFSYDKELILNEKSVVKSAGIFDNLFNTSDYKELDEFKSNSSFFEDYIKIIKRLKPKETVIRLMGPFSLMNEVSNVSLYNLINDRIYRKFFIQVTTLKALWYIKTIKLVSPETKPLILFEDHALNKFGTLKSKNEMVTNDNLTTIYAKLFQKIHSAGGYAGIECFEKCNWQLIIESGADLISFNAVNNHASLSIITDQINEFLSKGGFINWAFVPANTETAVKSLRIEDLSHRLEKIMNELVNDGVHRDLLYRNSTISVLGNVNNLPLLFAEKSLILSTHLGKKLSNLAASLHRNPQ